MTASMDPLTTGGDCLQCGLQVQLEMNITLTGWPMFVTDTSHERDIVAPSGLTYNALGRLGS